MQLFDIPTDIKTMNQTRKSLKITFFYPDALQCKAHKEQNKVFNANVEAACQSQVLSFSDSLSHNK